MSEGDWYIQCGRGRKGRQWAWAATENLVLQSVWESGREAALATKHDQLDAAALNGSGLGQAFLQCVIEDPRVQAIGRWLYLERPIFGRLFSEGGFPTVVWDRNPVQTEERPQNAVVGYAALKERWRGLPEGTLSHSARPLVTFPDPAPISSLAWNTKWPPVLDVQKLTEILTSQYRAEASYREDPTEGPIYHAAQALADRHQAFFDLLRGGVLLAEGTFMDTGQQLPVPPAQWNRKEKCLDIANGDLLEIDGKTRWQSLIVRMPK